MESSENLMSFLGKNSTLVRDALSSLEREKIVPRVWNKDASLWKNDSETQRLISDRLGWLTVAETMSGRISELLDFKEYILNAGFKDVVLLGMGGSSLCPEVLRTIFGVAAGCPQFHVLDTTNPSTICRIEMGINLEKTLFILASKSGSTIEVDSLYRYFLKKTESIHSIRAGSQFIAITDSGTPLEKMARERNFLKVFVNPSDIGGRYSALSYFGLVPALLIGMDLGVFINRALGMMNKCRSEISPHQNPGIQLGVILSIFGSKGKNKVTFVMPPSIRNFGIWLEQLIAESTGKEGFGLVPVEGERLGDAGCYGDDRLFVFYNLISERDSNQDKLIDQLSHAGHPVVVLNIKDLYDLAGEFFRWELATATVGIPWHINPFDEPNVKESKENTQKILEIFNTSGKMPESKVILTEKGVTLFGDQPLTEGAGLGEILKRFLMDLPQSYYLALLAYIDPSDEHENLLQEIRLLVRNRFRLATTLGYGPRFLHSTGQLHKGGKKEGAFIQITSQHSKDLEIPGKAYSFDVLNRSQSLGDLEALKKRGFPVLCLHLNQPSEIGLKYIAGELKRVLK
ncbi:MAG: glucose-6-phosphate isomerase [Nitrospiria bacterium]